MSKESAVSVSHEVATCRICGCTEERACEGGCSWVEDPENLGDICSQCLTNPRHVWKIPLEQIRPAPWNPPERLIPDPEMADSIMKEGQKQDALLRPVEAESPVRFEIVFGHRRYAARQLLAQKVDAALGVLSSKIEEMSEEQAMILTGIENLQRKGYTGFQEAQFFKLCAEKQGDSAVKILSERMSLREGYIRKRLRFLELPQPAIDLWKSGAWHIGHLEQLLRVGDQVEAFMQELGKRQWDKPAELTVRQLREKVDRLAVPLHSGRFDKSECKTCPKNTDVQRKLFDTEKEKTKCLDQLCFLNKQEAWLNLHWADCKQNKAKTPVAIIGDYNTKTTGKFDDCSCQPAEKCLACPKYASILGLNLEPVYHSTLMVCIGEESCFNGVKAAARNGKAEPATKTKANEKNPDVPRVAWHGEYYRQEFYHQELPGLMEALDLNDPRRLQQALAMVVYEHRNSLEDWLDQNTTLKAEALNWKNLAYFLDWVKNQVLLEDLQPLLNKAQIQLGLMKGYQAVFQDADRQAMAEFLDIDFANFQVTEEYLQKKTKAELVKFIVHDSRLMEVDKFQEFMEQRGYPSPEKLAQAKKGALVDLILQCPVDLHGRLPKEIADLPKLQEEGE
ncbi:MAG: ParB/RepB/Spo0J family partition protein [Thermodesulfobacteriota bacterium]